MEIRVLGELEVLDDGRRAGPTDLGGSKPKQLLELLTAARGHPVTKDTLVEQLWPVRPPQHPVAALENHVWVLRSHLLDGVPGRGSVVVAEPRAYRLPIDGLVIDLVRFDELVRAAQSAAPSDTRRYLERALSLVRGELFEDEPYADWATSLREAHRARLASVELDLAAAALVEGDAGATVEHAGRVLDADPLSEGACRLLMLGLAHRGERAHALRVFAAFRASLRAELRVEPMAETRAVYDSLRAGAAVAPPRPQVDARVPGHTSAASGVPASRALVVPSGGGTGLIGRADEIQALGDVIRRASRGRFAIVLVEGLAHVGKSAVVRDAVARSATTRRGWTRIAVRSPGQPHLPLLTALRAAIGSSTVSDPGARGLPPLEQLRTGLARHAPVVLVLDDLHRADGDAVEALVNLQLERPDLPVVVVGILRSEEVAYDHPLRSLDPTMHLRLGPLSAAQLDGFGGAAAHERTGGYGAYLPAWVAGDRAGPPSEDLLAAVLGRCQAAGDRAHRVLTVASALPEPFGPVPIATVTGLSVHLVAEQLDCAIARGLLRGLGGGFGFSASLVADALRSKISATRQELIRRVVASPPLVTAALASEDRQVQAL